MDYDHDGDLDILSGSYTGELYLFERDSSGEFIQGRHLLTADGNDLKAKGLSVTVEALDIDGDQDLDLVVGTRSRSVEIFVNEGTRAKPVYSGTSIPLETVDGEKIKGSNAHHADWDGDGIRDLILGSEYGGVHWHRNVGKNDAPRYKSREVILDKIEFKQREESDGPEGPGSRTKVFVSDFNGDGKTDLLVGDVQWLYYTLAPLTQEQEARKLALTPAFEEAEAALDKAYDERNSHVGEPDGIPEEVLARVEAANKIWRPLARKMSEFDRRKSNVHGWVWLYLREDSVASGE